MPMKISMNWKPTRRGICLSLVGTAVLGGCATGNSGVRPPPARAGATRVAALLPLSGRAEALGRQMAKAIWLAEDLGAAPTRAQILDAGDSPETAAAAAARAVGDGANILVGPLLRQQVPATLQAAQAVPVLTLSNDDALTGQGAWVFGVTPAQSAGAVLRYARESGARRITMLAAPAALGSRAAGALSAGARGARATILPPVPAATAPADMGAALRQAGSGSLPDILYVPGTGAGVLDQAVAAVATGVTTIGSLQWSGLPEGQFSRLDKACFTGPDPVRFDRMSSSFRAQLDEDMGVIAALAVDAVAFARTNGAKPAGRQPVDGLLGAVRFRPDRTAERALSVLRISGGGVARVA
ncbi:MAG: penicillin-binding protein activator [Marinibacterium sp.]